jgi:colanic acid biosynthesis glycosyl transferase WcaI
VPPCGARMARLVIFNHYFYPDESATSRMASSLAFGLADRGWRVHAVATRKLYASSGAALPSFEVIRGIDVHRIWTTSFGRRHLLGRGVDYLAFYFGVLWWVLRFTRASDLLIVATDPPLLSVLVAAGAWFTGAARINWLHDLYPEVAGALGLPTTKLGQRLLRRLRDQSLRGAVMNVAIGRRMASYLRRRGLANDRIAVVHNWSDGRSIRPQPDQGRALRQQWGLVGKYVVGYSGNLGRGHDFETILQAAERLRDRRDIAFLIIGAGYHLSLVEGRVKALALPNVVLKPFQPPSMLSESLSVPDLHLISLEPALEGFMVPCKFYGVLAAGRPALYIGDVAGEISAILRESDCGASISKGDVDGLLTCIQRLQRSPEQAKRWSSNARALFMRRFDREIALDHWCSILSRAAGDAAPEAVYGMAGAE